MPEERQLPKMKGSVADVVVVFVCLFCIPVLSSFGDYIFLVFTVCFFFSPTINPTHPSVKHTNSPTR